MDEPDEILERLLSLERAHLVPVPTGPAATSLLSPDFTEVGASGRRIDRAEAAAIVEARRADEASVGVSVQHPSVRLLGPGVALLTYDLHTPTRVTRRTSIWRHGPEGWQLTFHQGTPATPGQ